jgi:DNA polymerase-3 subunit epsilon
MPSIDDKKNQYPIKTIEEILEIVKNEYKDTKTKEEIVKIAVDEFMKMVFAYNKNASSVHNKRNKGKSILELIDDYVVVDIETTGLSPEYDEIIELSSLRIKNNEIIDQFSTLCKPNYEIPVFITELTGITNDMVKDAPKVENILEEYINFIGNSIIIGHNVNFDINFIYDNYKKYYNKELSNNFIDTMRLSRRALPELEHHRLIDLSEYFNIKEKNSHRGLIDCDKTFKVYVLLKKYIQENNIPLNIKTYGKNLDVKSIQPNINIDDIDDSNFFYGKYCVFTGELEKMIRKDAAQIIANLGGVNENRITKKTNFLILGNNDYCKTIKDGKSTKQKKAEEYILQGQDLSVISENVFYDMIAE